MALKSVGHWADLKKWRKTAKKRLARSGPMREQKVIYSKKERNDDRKKAIWAGRDKFTGICGACGPSDFDTWAAHCIACAALNTQPIAKLRARSLGSLYYRDVCKVHGEHDHSGLTRKCLGCYNSNGLFRPAGFNYAEHARKRDMPFILAEARNPARADARRAGSTQYVGQCEVHGEGAHSVLYGKCLMCFTTAGMPRKRPEKDVNPARADARRAGSTQYVGQCDVHGEVPHSTNRNKCLTCFDTLGRPRKNPVVRGNPARAAARRAGETVYLEWCDEHGAGDHSVLHGKCLTCFNSAGFKRKWARITPA